MPGEHIQMPRKFPFPVDMTMVITKTECGYGVARGPLVQDEYPRHIHYNGYAVDTGACFGQKSLLGLTN
jgi:hypothetical protein